MKTIAEFIPSKVRGVIYAIIGAYLLLDPIWNLTPEGYGGKVSATLAALGFGLATVNTDLVPPKHDDWQPDDRGESTVVTLAAVAVIVVAIVWLLSVYR